MPAGSPLRIHRHPLDHGICHAAREPVTRSHPHHHSVTRPALQDAIPHPLESLFRWHSRMGYTPPPPPPRGRYRWTRQERTVATMPPTAADDSDAYALPLAGSLKLKGGTSTAHSFHPHKRKHTHGHKHKHHSKRSRSPDDSRERTDRAKPDRRSHRHHRHNHQRDASSPDPRETERAVDAIAARSADGASPAAEASAAVSERDDTPDAQPKRRRYLTKSEAKFEEARLKRLGQRVSKEASVSHKDRVEAFNNHLASLTEHFDMPKVRAPAHNCSCAGVRSCISLAFTRSIAASPAIVLTLTYSRLGRAKTTITSTCTHESDSAL